jgi:crossover junction endodeoxyribonuclease RuvC
MGVDPGAVSAAYALLDTNGNRAIVDDVPVLDKMVNAAEFARLVRKLRPSVAIVELVGSMPGQGVASTFKFGKGCGMLQGVLAALEIPLMQVTPAKWKRAFGLTSDKEKARAFAIRTFPAVEGLSRKRDAGRAEALLLAYYWSVYGNDIV